MLSTQTARPQLLRRLLDAPRRRTRPREGADGIRQVLAMICPRCRLPMLSVGSSAEERLEDGEPYLRHRWRCRRCRTGACL